MPVNITLFLESRKGYYYYFNWTAGKENENKIHYCECGHCNYGSGQRREQKRGLHGVWVGPFVNLEDADHFVGQIVNRPINHCNCTNR